MPQNLAAFDKPRYRLALATADHREQELLHRFARVQTRRGKRGLDAFALAFGQPRDQRYTIAAWIQQTLAPIVLPANLRNEAAIAQVLQHPRKTLLGDIEDFEEIGNANARMPANEMQRPVMRAPEAQLGEDFIGISGEVAVGEEQAVR